MHDYEIKPNSFEYYIHNILPAARGGKSGLCRSKEIPRIKVESSRCGMGRHPPLIRQAAEQLILT